MIKKIKYIILLAIVFALGLTINNSFARITTNDPTVNSGGTVTITIGSQEPVASGSINISSNSGLTFKSVSGGTANGSRVAFAKTDNTTSGLATYTFTAPTVTTDTTYKVVFSSVDMANAEGTPVASSSATATVTVKAPAAQPTPSTPATPATPSTPSTPATTKNKTTTKTTTTNKPTENKETKQEETPQEDNFYISSLVLKGIKENGEEVEIALSPEFNKDVFDYTTTIPGDVEKIDIQKDAGQYTNSIIVTGAEQLIVGENIITLQLSAEDHEAKIYTIKATKEELIEELKMKEVTTTEDEKVEKEQVMFSMPLWLFIVIQAGVIVFEVLGILLVFKKKYNSNI